MLGSKGLLFSARVAAFKPPEPISTELAEPADAPRGGETAPEPSGSEVASTSDEKSELLSAAVGSSLSVAFCVISVAARSEVRGE